MDGALYGPVSLTYAVVVFPLCGFCIWLKALVTVFSINGLVWDISANVLQFVDG